MSNPRIPFQLSTERPPLPALQGKRLLVHVVVNVEVWPFDQPMPRALLSSPHGARPVPDVPNFSWVEYGLRCGLPRILRVLADRSLPASASCNAAVIDVYPAAAEAMLGANWAFIGHGVQQRALTAEDDERAVIVETLDRIEAFTGSRPGGWLGPGLAETTATPDILADEGIDHVYDWALDDLPTWMATTHGPLVALPYSLELNDSVLHAVEAYPAAEFHRRVRDTLVTFDQELDRQPRILTLPLHPHLAGVPHRIGQLAAILDEVLQRDDVAFVTGEQLADWFRAAQPRP